MFPKKPNEHELFQISTHFEPKFMVLSFLYRFARLARRKRRRTLLVLLPKSEIPNGWCQKRDGPPFLHPLDPPISCVRFFLLLWILPSLVCSSFNLWLVGGLNLVSLGSHWFIVIWWHTRPIFTRSTCLFYRTSVSHCSMQSWFDKIYNSGISSKSLGTS